MNLDLAAPLRAALLAASGISSRLATYSGEPAIFTRRPLPADATYPLIMINPAAGIGDQDYLNNPMPIVMRDVAVYGNQPGDYRAVESMAYDMRELFHRNRWAITPDGYDVVQIVANGPHIGATDDQTTVGRVVGLTIQLRRHL